MTSILITKDNISNHSHMKIQTQDWELNIHLSEQELVELKHIRSANWNARQSIKAGVSANASVFWAYNNDRETVSVLIGQDDESWDFGVMLPLKDLLDGLNTGGLIC